MRIRIRRGHELFVVLAALAILASCAHRPRGRSYAPGAVVVEQNYRHEEVVRLKPVELGRKWDALHSFELEAVTDATPSAVDAEYGVEPRAVLTLHRSGADWAYRECRDVKLVAGSEHYDPRDEQHHGELAQQGVAETLEVEIPRNELARLASAADAAIEVCEDRLELSDGHRKYIDEFVSTWEQHTPAPTPKAKGAPGE